MQLTALVLGDRHSQDVAYVVEAVDAQALPEQVVPDRLEAREPAAATAVARVARGRAPLLRARVVVDGTPAVVHRLQELTEVLERRGRIGGERL
jgi:hypothetical protein